MTPPCEWLEERRGPRGGRRKSTRCGRSSTHEVATRSGPMPLCRSHTEAARAVFIGNKFSSLLLREYLRAAGWCVLVAEKSGERIRRYFKGESWPYDPPEPLDYTAHAIYQRARERLAAARARLELDRSSR